MQTYDWASITNSAYQTLLELGIHEFPIPIRKIKLKGVKICSYQRYCQITGMPIEVITLGHELDDAFLLQGLRPGLKMILYDEEKYNPRMKHTLLHEIGHIKCNHKKHSEKEEIEAHFFAAQANAPNALIKEVARRGYNIDIPFLVNCFRLSEESAKKKMSYFSKYHFNHINEFDDVIIQQFQNFINTIYPPRVSQYDDEYYDDLDRKRENWY